MSLFSFDDLVTPLTQEEVKKSLYDVLGIVGTNTTSWKEGAVVRTMVAGTSVMGAAFSRLMASIARGGFLDLADGQWLTLKAYYDYRVSKRENEFATGKITLNNIGGGIFDLDEGEVIFRNSRTGKTFRNSEDFSLASLQTGLKVGIVATESGSDSTSPAGEIDEVVSGNLTDVEVVNEGDVIGRDDEEPPALRKRCIEKLGSFSLSSPRDAYVHFAKNSKREDGTDIEVTRVRVVADGTGSVRVIVANAAGGIAGDQEDPSTDLGAIHENLYRWASTINDTVTTEGAVSVQVPVSYRLWAKDGSGLSATQFEASVLKALQTFMPKQPIGGNIIGAGLGKLFLDDLRAAIHGAREEIFHVEQEITEDIDLEINEVPVLSTVTATSITFSNPER